MKSFSCSLPSCLLLRLVGIVVFNCSVLHIKSFFFFFKFNFNCFGFLMSLSFNPRVMNYSNQSIINHQSSLKGSAGSLDVLRIAVVLIISIVKSSKTTSSLYNLRL